MERQFSCRRFASREFAEPQKVRGRKGLNDAPGEFVIVPPGILWAF